MQERLTSTSGIEMGVIVLAGFPDDSLIKIIRKGELIMPIHFVDHRFVAELRNIF